MNAQDQERWTAQFGEYKARPKRTRRVEGVDHVYVTVRCRRKGNEGEWPLGSFTTVRQMTEAFYDWVAERRTVQKPVNSTTLLRDVIAEYKKFVDDMGLRPKTRDGRHYTASQLAHYVAVALPDIQVGDFDTEAFAAYLKWMRERTKKNKQGLAVPYYKPQTIQNALIGARTLLRWAATQKYITEAPAAPTYAVPDIEHAPVYVEDIEAVIAASEKPLDLMLRLMWENGLRIAEAMYLRPADLRVDECELSIREHGTFKPKTRKSTRKVPVTPEMMDALVELAEGKEPHEDLFPCDVKSPYHYWAYRFAKARKAAGVGHLTFHDLRRATADRLRNVGTPVGRYCDIMGHAAITGLRHYKVSDPEDLHADHHRQLQASRSRKRPTRRRRPARKAKRTDREGDRSGYIDA